MKLHLLGTGTPIIDKRRQLTAFLVDSAGEKILFDTGRGVTAQLLQIDVHPAEIDAVFITHHHYDHIGGLGDFLLTAWHNGRTQPLPVYGPIGTKAIVDALFNHVYARDIQFTLFSDPDTPDIRQIVTVKDIGAGSVVTTSNWHLSAEYVNHGNSLGLSSEVWPCLGYRLESAGKALAIGGDAVDCEGLALLAKDANLLVLACYLAKDELNSPGFIRLAQHIIAASDQVGKIAARARVRKLVLTHFRPKSAQLMQTLENDVRADFAGELFMGEDLLATEV